MKTTLFKEVGYTMNKLIQDIDAGEIGLPDIQRPLVLLCRRQPGRSEGGGVLVGKQTGRASAATLTRPGRCRQLSPLPPTLLGQSQNVSAL